MAELCSYAINSPSGDHDGQRVFTCFGVRFLDSDPSTFITHRFGRSPRSETNAIRAPSGERAGMWSTPGLAVSRTTLEPSGSIANMFLLPSLSEANTILEPSPDQEGWLSSPGLFVMFRWSDPSAFITYISQLPSRLEMKAIRDMVELSTVGVGSAAGVDEPQPRTNSNSAASDRTNARGYWNLSAYLCTGGTVPPGEVCPTCRAEALGMESASASGPPRSPDASSGCIRLPPRRGSRATPSGLP